MSEILSNKDVTIRKPHKCFGCLQIFEPGIKMRVQALKYDNRLYRLYTCEVCDYVMDKNYDGDDWPEGFMFEFDKPMKEFYEEMGKEMKEVKP